MKRTILGLLTLLTFCGTVFAEEDAPAEKTWAETKFGTELINASGKKFKTADALKDKLVLVYFSASWCPPCRAFTPKLVDFYKKAIRQNEITVVLVGWDKTADAMKNYMKKYAMPWYAVPFEAPENAAVKRELTVNGIPALAVYEKDGRLLSGGARWDVMLLGTKAVDAWRSPAYTPKTLEDYKKTLPNKSRGKRRK